ncbi:hypothetical protein [Cognatilysobacter bugurensis]|uniref:Uncharacterized protein n=1 Tax=Cognatilysobacter bugurensis TaxID=543356 RepID=A0A918SUZ6_9GAMM|nr:hypothetical protein [Lysobacter bugurensis]GHA72239.1 hypothetical protein GCM10007067_05890 [Lysobacter bugurensis]
MRLIGLTLALAGSLPLQPATAATRPSPAEFARYADGLLADASGVRFAITAWLLATLGLIGLWVRLLTFSVKLGAGGAGQPSRLGRLVPSEGL